MASLHELDRRLADMGRQTAHHEGRRQQLAAREADLVRTVGLAKGRLGQKAKVDAFLEALQAQAHERTVGSYSKLLSAVANDVLPQDLKIVLDLYTERGLPSLDLYAEKGENRVGILDGCGGSLINVTSLGLRAIATVKSGLRPFLAIDEGDCWIAPLRVPAYYRVMKQMAAKMNFQALIISHHDVSLFDAGINILAVSGTSEEGLVVTPRAGAAAWPDDVLPGIRAIVMRNVASYKDAVMRLSPGLNAIIGDNNQGKSRVMALLRSIAYAGGEANDDIIRFGEKRAESEIHLEKGQVLHWSREKKRNPVNLWRLVDANGKVVELPDGTRCETGGKLAPDWVAQVLGIARVDGLDIQLAHQATPVFLLDKSAPQRAAVLSIGRESGHLRTMITAHKDNCQRDNVTVKTGEQEIAAVRGHLAVLGGLDGITALLEQGQAHRECAAAALARAEAAAAVLGRLEHARAAAARAEAEAAVLEAVPAVPDLSANLERERAVTAVGRRLSDGRAALARAEAERAALDALPGEPPALTPSETIAAAGRRIRDAWIALADAEAIEAALADLPEQAPALAASDAAQAAVQRIAAASAALAKAESERAALGTLPGEGSLPTLRNASAALGALERLSQLRAAIAAASEQAQGLEADERACADEIAETLAGMGNLCPLCGSNVKHDHILAQTGALETA